MVLEGWRPRVWVLRFRLPTYTDSLTDTWVDRDRYDRQIATVSSDKRPNAH